jgi:hypothetical protein
MKEENNSEEVAQVKSNVLEDLEVEGKKINEKKNIKKNIYQQKSGIMRILLSFNLQAKNFY